MCKVYSVHVKQAPVSHVGLCVKKKFHVDLNFFVDTTDNKIKYTTTCELWQKLSELVFILTGSRATCPPWLIYMYVNIPIS